jgi:hypothetical protein
LQIWYAIALFASNVFVKILKISYFLGLLRLPHTFTAQGFVLLNYWHALVHLELTVGLRLTTQSTVLLFKTQLRHSMLFCIYLRDQEEIVRFHPLNQQKYD